MPADLEGLDGLVLPGGESTTMTLGIAREGLAEPLRDLAAAGTPILGTCAGLIMLDRDHLGIMDTRAERNAFGRQVRSFEADLDLPGVDGPPMRAVFIRAPWIAEHGPGRARSSPRSTATRSPRARATRWSSPSTRSSRATTACTGCCSPWWRTACGRTKTALPDSSEQMSRPGESA